jgi:ankyrin repeat protein
MKAEVNAMDNDGRTAVMIAVDKEDVTCLQMLLQAGADTTLKDKRGRTALRVALFDTKNHSAAKVLMTDKTALDLVDDDNRTLLMIAAEKEDLTALEMLLHAGANTALRDKVGISRITQ